MNFSRKVLQPRSLAQGGIYVFGLALGALLLYYAQSFYVIRVRHTNLVLGLCLVVFYLGRITDVYSGAQNQRTTGGVGSVVPVSILDLDAIKTTRRVYATRIRPVIYLLLAVISIIVVAYVDIHHVRMMEHGPVVGYRTADYVVGATIIYLCTDVTTRAFGKVMGSIIPLGFLYGYLGPYLPGVLFHSGMDTSQLLRIMVLGLDGVYGFILQIGATWVAIFLILAGLAQGYGILDYLTELSREVSKIFKSGIIHSAVLASLAFGSITGASAANTATTGSFTIPMMKDQGVDKGYAGGIETVASIGGQLVPPVMGIAAFIMVDFISVSYVRIIQAGLIPAILFYLSIVVSVHLLAYKHDWVTARDIRNVDYSTFFEFFWYLPPIGILIYLLAVLQYTPLTAGYYTVLSMLGIVLLKYLVEGVLERDPNPSTPVWSRKTIKQNPFSQYLRDTVEGVKEGAVLMAPLLVILGAIGVIITVFTQTGFSQRLNTLMVTLSGGSIFLLLVLAMGVSILFGMGMPAPAAYVLVASLGGAAMIRFGIQDLVAHMFVFYYAMYSSLTPPVGPSTIVAAKIADATYWDTAVKASRLAIPGFIIPFVFVANDVLIYWEFPVTILVGFTAALSVTILCMALVAYDGLGRLSVIGRVIFSLLAFLGFFGVYLGWFSIMGQVAVAVVILAILGSSFAPAVPGVAQFQAVIHKERSLV